MLTSHRRRSELLATLGEWLVDAVIGAFLGVVLALVGWLITIWVMVLQMQ